MDHKHRACDWLRSGERADPEDIRSLTMGQFDVLLSIAHTLLAIHEELADIRAAIGDMK